MLPSAMTCSRLGLIGEFSAGLLGISFLMSTTAVGKVSIEDANLFTATE